jgi:hypothetical protein
MNFSPVSLQELDGRKVWKSVFPSEWTDPYIYGEDFKWDPETDMEKYANPDYRPQYDINLSNGNAHHIMNECLGFQQEEYSFTVDIDWFISRAQQWLKVNFNHQSKAIESVQIKNIVECGRPEGYTNIRIYNMLVIAKEGRDLGATHISMR